MALAFPWDTKGGGGERMQEEIYLKVAVQGILYLKLSKHSDWLLKMTDCQALML